MATVHRSVGWLGVHTECSPYRPTGEVTQPHMRALETEVGHPRRTTPGRLRTTVTGRSAFEGWVSASG